MKGAITLPLLNTISNPNVTIITTVGISQSFFLDIRNLNNSYKVDIRNSLYSRIFNHNLKIDLRV